MEINATEEKIIKRKGESLHFYGEILPRNKHKGYRVAYVWKPWDIPTLQLAVILTFIIIILLLILTFIII